MYPGSLLHSSSTPLEDVTPEARQRLGEIKAHIRSLYLSGKPIFTREAIRDLGEQLKSLKGKTGKVFVTGLDGVRTEFAVLAGTSSFWGDSLEDVFGAPYIEYCSLQTLTLFTNINYEPRLSYCSLHVGHYLTTIRNRFTKETVVFKSSPGSPGSLVNSFKPPESPEASRGIFNSSQQKWEESERCKHLRNLLQSITLPKMHQIIAFACGSIRYDLWPDVHPRSSFQHALIITLRDILMTKKEGPADISCYAQDPAYIEADRLILDKNNIAILNDPDGFVNVDDSTFVLSFAPQVPVRQIVMDIARPAAMIWGIIKEDEDVSILPPGVHWSDPDSPRMWETIRELYEVFELPGWSENFGDVALYVRKAAYQSPTLLPTNISRENEVEESESK